MGRKFFSVGKYRNSISSSVKKKLFYSTKCEKKITCEWRKRKRQKIELKWRVSYDDDGSTQFKKKCMRETERASERMLCCNNFIASLSFLVLLSKQFQAFSIQSHIASFFLYSVLFFVHAKKR